MIAFLRSAAAVTIAVLRATSFVFDAFTTSMSGMTATGLKKWKPTRRSGCFSLAPISSTDSDEVLVARIASSATCFSTSAKTCCLTPSSSNTASMTQSQSAKSALSIVPVTSPLSRLASSESMRPFPSSSSISPRMVSTPLSTCAWSRSVMTTGTCSRRTNSSANWVAMRPAPTIPTLFTGRASALSGAPAGFLARFCTRLNA